VIDYQGNFAEQDFDVIVDAEAGDLVVTVNGETYLRLGLPRLKWRALHHGAARAIDRMVAREIDG